MQVGGARLEGTGVWTTVAAVGWRNGWMDTDYTGVCISSLCNSVILSVD